MIYMGCVQMFRTLHDGSLISTRAVNPPEGYIRDPKNNRHYLIKLNPCQHREDKYVKRKCCGGIELYCNKLEEFVNRKICKECTLCQE